MTLRKFVSMKSVGRFLNFTAAGDVELKRYNLIFAENGRGKTTLCSILRSLQTGATQYITGRATLGSTTPQEVEILLSAGTARFRNSAWSQTVPEILIFDSQFISENIYAGDYVDTEHKRNLYRIIIGAQGVTLAQRVDALDTQIRAANTELRDAKAAVQVVVPAGLQLEAFIGLSAEPDVDARIETKRRELEAAQQADQIRLKPALAQLVLPEIPNTFIANLQGSIAGIAADSEQKVTQHLAAHAMQQHGRQWISQGLGYLKTDACPFCGLDTRASDIIAAYKGYFSAAYDDLKVNIASTNSEIQTKFNDATVLACSRTLDNNATLSEFWSRYCSIQISSSPNAADLEAALRAQRDAALALLTRKTSAPLDQIDVDQPFKNAEAAIGVFRVAVNTYNTAVTAANVQIAAKKAAVAGASVATLQGELARLEAQKLRHSTDVVRSCQRLATATTHKTGLEQQKDQAKDQLDQHTNQVITQYQNSINTYLDRFHAGFSIGSTAHNYRGGTPSSSYQIIINQRPVDLGDSETPLDRPSFKNTLSGGDKSALALSFFLAKLDQDPGLAQRIVVFDDPFTSQDRFRRLSTSLQIKRLGEQCAQIVVLSHEALFLKVLWDNLAAAERKTLYMVRVADNNTLIREWDIEDFLQDHFRSDVEALQKYHITGEGDPRQVVRRIRPVVEGYCLRAQPGGYNGQTMLGGIVGRIRDVGPTHPLHVIADELDELNIYSRRYHHTDQTQPADAPAEPIDGVELAAYARKALKIVGCL